jgi:hypothetical protein
MADEFSQANLLQVTNKDQVGYATLDEVADLSIHALKNASHLSSKNV